MPGIVLAFLTPDSDKRKWRKRPLLKPCLLDIGHPCDTAASIGYFVSETWNIVVTELREEEPRQPCGVTAGGKRTGVGDQPSTGKKKIHEVVKCRLDGCVAELMRHAVALQGGFIINHTMYATYARALKCC